MEDWNKTVLTELAAYCKAKKTDEFVVNTIRDKCLASILRKLDPATNRDNPAKKLSSVIYGELVASGQVKSTARMIGNQPVLCLVSAANAALNVVPSSTPSEAPSIVIDAPATQSQTASEDESSACASHDTESTAHTTSNSEDATPIPAATDAVDMVSTSDVAIATDGTDVLDTPTALPRADTPIDMDDEIIEIDVPTKSSDERNPLRDVDLRKSVRVAPQSAEDIVRQTPIMRKSSRDKMIGKILQQLYNLHHIRSYKRDVNIKAYHQLVCIGFAGETAGGDKFAIDTDAAYHPFAIPSASVEQTNVKRFATQKQLEFARDIWCYNNGYGLPLHIPYFVADADVESLVIRYILTNGDMHRPRATTVADLENEAADAAKQYFQAGALLSLTIVNNTAELKFRIPNVEDVQTVYVPAAKLNIGVI